MSVEEPLLPLTANQIAKRNSGSSSSSVYQATFNNVGVIVGLGMLSCPYALQNSGWLGLIFLLLCGLIFCYTAYLLSLCLASKPGTCTYQQVAELACGTNFRILVTVIAFLELLGALVGFTISLSTNLVKIFPQASISNSWLSVPANVLLPVLAVALVLPIIWMRSLSWISYVSLGGITAYLIVVLAVLWAGVADGIGFHHQLNLLNPSGLARASGLYLFCYSGHLVIPRIHSSMKEPSKYPLVAILSFSIATVIYIAVGVAGATMFGDKIESQVTLNLPKALPVAEVALWVVILIPLTKYALNVNPIAVELERFVSWRDESPALQNVSGMSIRTLIMAAVLTLAFSVPSFEATLSLVGSAISTLNCVVLPCVFHLRIFRQSISKKQRVLNWAVLVTGVLMAVVGSIASVI